MLRKHVSTCTMVAVNALGVVLGVGTASCGGGKGGSGSGAGGPERHTVPGCEGLGSTGGMQDGVSRQGKTATQQRNREERKHINNSILKQTHNAACSIINNYNNKREKISLRLNQRYLYFIT